MPKEFSKQVLSLIITSMGFSLLHVLSLIFRIIPDVDFKDIFLFSLSVAIVFSLLLSEPSVIITKKYRFVRLVIYGLLFSFMGYIFLLLMTRVSLPAAKFQSSANIINILFSTTTFLINGIQYIVPVCIGYSVAYACIIFGLNMILMAFIEKLIKKTKL